MAMMDVGLEGTALLIDPLLNKGSAFTEGERTAFALHGLLPPHIGTLDEQVDRRLQAVRKFETKLERCPSPKAALSRQEQRQAPVSKGPRP